MVEGESRDIGRRSGAVTSTILLEQLGCSTALSDHPTQRSRVFWAPTGPIPFAIWISTESSNQCRAVELQTLQGVEDYARSSHSHRLPVALPRPSMGPRGQTLVCAASWSQRGNVLRLLCY
jgi:hypothetical protein